MAVDYAAARQKFRQRAREHDLQIARARAVLRLCAAAQFGAGLGFFYALAARQAFILEVLAAGTIAIGAGALLLRQAERL